MVRLSVAIVLLSLELALAVIGKGGDCGNLGNTAAVLNKGVPDPHGVEEMGTRVGRRNDASAESNDSGSCLVSTDVDPGSGDGSPCGWRGPGSPLASRPVRGQRIGSVEGWGGLGNHCKDVCLGSKVGGNNSGACVDSDEGIVCSATRVPDPGDEEEEDWHWK